MNFNDININNETIQTQIVYKSYINKICKHISEKYNITCKNTQLKSSNLFVIGFNDKETSKVCKFCNEIQSILLDFDRNPKYVEVVLSSSTISKDTMLKIIDTISEIFDDFTFIQRLKLFAHCININEIKKLNKYVKHYEF